MASLSKSGHLFEELIAPLRPELKMFAGKLCRSTKHDVEDIVQDVFFKAWEQWKHWSPTHADAPEGCAKAWMYRITSNLVTDRFRKSPKFRARLSMIEQCPTMNFTVSSGSSPEAQPLDRSVDSAIDKLDPELQSYVRRHYVGHTSMKQLASGKRNVASVKKLLMRARSQLKPLLEQYAAEHYALGRTGKQSSCLEASQVEQADSDSVDGIVRRDNVVSLVTI